MKILIKINILFAILASSSPNSSLGELCNKWSQASVAGFLNHSMLAEASGMAISKLNNNRLYHVNDSGNGSFFYTTKMDGSNTKSIQIEGYNSSKADFEDITVGPCNSKTCLFIGDIGDNTKSRDYIKILIIEEKSEFKPNLKPNKIVKLSYPDHPHDAEALAIHPNGDLYIFSKEANYKRHKAFPSKLFRIEKDKWENSASDPVMLELVGTLDIKSINKVSTGFFDNLITSFDIASNGKKFVALTYQNAYEFNIDLSVANSDSFKSLIKNKDYNTAEIKRLPQQESIAYLPGSKSLLYDSEYIAVKPKLIRIDCLE